MDPHDFDDRVAALVKCERQPASRAFWRGCLVGSMIGAFFGFLYGPFLATESPLAPHVPAGLAPSILFCGAVGMILSAAAVALVCGGLFALLAIRRVAFAGPTEAAPGAEPDRDAAPLSARSAERQDDRGIVAGRRVGDVRLDS